MVLICREEVYQHSWVKIGVILWDKKNSRKKNRQMSIFYREIKEKKAKKVDFPLFLHSYQQKWDDIAWGCYNVLLPFMYKKIGTISGT